VKVAHPVVFDSMIVTIFAITEFEKHGEHHLAKLS
jgi:hypothetical protein